MTVNPISRAISTVLSWLQSSTRRISSTEPFGISSTVFRSVAAALYAGITAIVRPLRAIDERSNCICELVLVVGSAPVIIAFAPLLGSIEWTIQFSDTVDLNTTPCLLSDNRCGFVHSISRLVELVRQKGTLSGFMFGRSEMLRPNYLIRCVIPTPFSFNLHERGVLTMRLPRCVAKAACRLFFGFACLLWQQTARSESPTATWQAGFAKVMITPERPMWLSGYGGRTKSAEGKVHELYARAAALRGPSGKTAVFVSTDLIGVPVKMARLLTEFVEKQYGLSRADLMLTCSHTHCGPALDHKLSYMLAMNDEDWQQVREYQKQLNDKLMQAIDRALNDLQPARLSTGIGRCGFAANRRSPRGLGPYDHDVPILRVTTPDGSRLRGVIFGYACHNTTLSFYQWCGDYAGFAALDLEDRHPESVALFFTGCGADQNPLPRRHVRLAIKYGRLLSVAVEQVLSSEMEPVQGQLKTAFKHIDLAFHSLPTQAELKDQRKNGNRYVQARASLLLKQLEDQGELAKTYSFPVQVWELGNNVTWVALGGEVVVDYSIRLKNELGRGRTWVTGYANDVMGYIPSERVLEEGGYEGESSMIYYQLPSKWKAGLEQQIVNTVKALSQSMRQ